MEKYYVKVITVLIAFFAPIAHLLLLMAVLVLFDFITGLLKSWYNNSPITSAKMRNTVGKFIVYTILIIAFHILDVYFIQPIYDVQLFYKVAMFMLALIEITSINENVTEILGCSPLVKIRKWFEKKGEI